jgi:hypothetical protein
LTSDGIGYPVRGGVDRDPRELFDEPSRWTADETEWSRQVKSKQFRLMAATAGGAAVLAMGALTVTFSNVSVAEEPPEPPPPGPVTTSEVTIGETATETVVPEAPPSEAVAPPITTTPSAFPPTAVQP